MYKITISFLFVFLTFSIAADDSYVFEAKGAFAKDLKALVEKYKKEGKVEVTVYKKSDLKTKKSKTITDTILSAFSGSDLEALKNADIDEGKRSYQNKCARCHGINADKNSYANSRKLSTLNPKEIVDLINGYRSNIGYRSGSNRFGEKQFGGSTRFIMKPQAENLVPAEISSIAVYIYSLKHSQNLPAVNNDSNNQQEVKEEKSSYLQ